MPEPKTPLHELARLYGVQTSYHEIDGRLVTATPDGLVRILRALGSPVDRPEDAPNALTERRQFLWRRGLEPVTVAWDGNPHDLRLHVAAADLDRIHHCKLAIEDGPTYDWSLRPSELPSLEEVEVAGTRYSARRMHLLGPYPFGYHRLTVESDAGRHECTLISAPVRPIDPKDKLYSARGWGVFIPLYALHTRQSWGGGDFADLEALVEWVQGQGGSVVATLPLLAGFLDEPYEPSPYSPITRLFWNEFYINVARFPEVQRSARARELLGSKELKDEVAALRGEPLVDYRRQMALKRRVLEECARTLFSEPSPRLDQLRRYGESRAELHDYAAFRAVGDRLRAAWQTWPAAQRDGRITEADYDQDAYRYHLYNQWLADEQLQGIASKARAGGPGLYLDLPLGVNASGYDVWKHRDLFPTDMAAGAPPDPFFAKGQNWGFPPPHPERLREQGYSYVRDYLRHHLSLAGILRIDHMMGLHRLYWVPQGMDARDGVYVGYHADEAYAVFVLEAHRRHAILVGEDLGTVPPEVPQMMARHDVHRMYVMQFQARPEQKGQELEPVVPGSVASFNTHDLPMFAAFWQGLDIEDRVALGILDRKTADEEKKRRRRECEAMEKVLQRQGLLKKPGDLQTTLRACLLYICHGPCIGALATLEDFWLEEKPQNVPGTWRERPNWQRRARHSLEETDQMRFVKETLRAMDRVIRSGTP